MGTGILGRQVTCFMLSLSISEKNCSKMKKHVASVYPEEACGLLAGKDGVITAITPIANRLRSAHRYFMEPQALWVALMQMEAQKLEWLGIYHSHPQGPATPSNIDRDEAVSPKMVYVIWTPAGTRFAQGNVLDEQLAIVWHARGFLINGECVTEVELAGC